MTTYSLPTPKVAVSRSNFLHVAAILSSAILATGYAGPVSADSLSVGTKSAATVDSPSSERTLLAQASGEDTMARCQQLFGLWSRHTTDGYAKPLDARMALEDCQKGNIASGVATLKRALERAQIPIPPAESATAPEVGNSASAQTPSDPKARCDQLTAYYDRYGVGRSENSDGARNHTRIAAGIDCEQGQYEKGISAMEALLKSKNLAVPPVPTGVAQTPAPLKPRGEKRRLAQ
jgi:hypothetical protein